MHGSAQRYGVDDAEGGQALVREAEHTPQVGTYAVVEVADEQPLGGPLAGRFGQ